MISIAPTLSLAVAKSPKMLSQEIDARTPPPAASPDLAVAKIQFVPNPATTTDVVTISATIRNEGMGASSNTQVQFLDGSVPIGTTNIGRLKAEKSVTTSITATFEEGSHSITASVNVANDPNTANNARTEILQVGMGQEIHDIAITSVTPSKTTTPTNQPVVITVEVANQGTSTETTDVTAYYASTAIGTQTITLDSASSKSLTFTWIPTTEGTFTISAAASTVTGETNTDNNQKVDGTVTVTSFTYNLIIEIDWMPGHYPTQAVLDYMQNYYSSRGIQVTYEIAADPVPLDSSVSTRDFWAIESVYNAGPDNAGGNSYNGKYTLQYKWVLFGTTVQGQPNVVGYCYTTGSTDLLAGNYIYMADQTADSWAGQDTNIQTGAEATVLMHEVGHAIGIAILSSSGSEVYCSDGTCVMSYLNAQNAANINNCHYCATHWSTKNLEYY